MDATLNTHLARVINFVAGRDRAVEGTWFRITASGVHLNEFVSYVNILAMAVEIKIFMIELILPY